MKQKHVTLAAAILAGCSSGPSLAGKWTVSGAGLPPIGSATIECDATTCTQRIEMEQPVPLRLTMKSTYEIEGEKLTMTVTDYTVDDRNLPAAMRPMVEAAKEKIEEQLKRPQSGTIRASGDTVTITGTGQGEMTLTKIK